MTIGSIEGTGNVFLGARKLTVGSNNFSTTFSGIVQDTGGIFFGTGGSLAKIGTGTLTLSGANIYTGGTTVSGGTLEVNGSILGAATVNDGATLAGTGSVGGLVTVESGGTISPGNSPGTLTVGALTLNSGSIAKFELAGIAPAEFDRMVVSLGASLGGTLQVSLGNAAFNPAAGDSFDILDWGGLIGTFGAIELPTLAGGVMWNASELYTDGVLRVTLLGDYNHDGIVDAADYTVWRNSLGQLGTGLAADGNGNGRIDGDDYGIWKAHYGEGSLGGGGQSIETVPEPESFAIMILCLIALAVVC